MHGLAVRRGMHGDGLDAQFLGGAQDAQRDFATVRDEDLVEHDGLLVRGAHSITSRGSPYSTGWPSSTRMAVTTPLRGATMSLKVFMASISKILSPAFT